MQQPGSSNCVHATATAGGVAMSQLAVHALVLHAPHAGFACRKLTGFAAALSRGACFSQHRSSRTHRWDGNYVTFCLLLVKEGS